MTDFLLTFVTSTARTLAGDESGLITRNGGIYSDGADAVTVTSGNNWLTNDGYLYAYDGGFSAVDSGSTVFELLNGRDGIITAESPTLGTLDLRQSFLADVTNHGIIHSSSNRAINFWASDDGASFYLDNFGEISANNGPVVDIDVGTGFTYITNHGTISGGNVIDLDADATSLNSMTITNHGTITSQSGYALSINVGDGATVYIVNTGTITSFNDTIGSFRDTSFRITNTGTIASLDPLNQDVIEIGGGNDQIVNYGEIAGIVKLGGGNDMLRNMEDGVTNTFIYGEAGNDTLLGGGNGDIFEGGAGDDRLIGVDGDDSLNGGAGLDTIRGGAGDDDILGGDDADEIHGGSSDDVIDGEGGADLIFGDSGSDMILGGAGDDTILGGSGEDDINGGADNDEIEGGSGDDVLRGDSGDDTISAGSGDDIMAGNAGDDGLDGGSGDDRIFGGSGNDTLEGTLGNDLLNGGLGDDLLRGGSDDDRLIGGEGQDTLDGGWGADVFVWTSASESPWNARDTVEDFTPGEDVIHISAIHPSLAWTPGGFTGVAGQVWFSDTTDTLWVDMNGSGGANFGIDLDGVSALDAGDLIL